MKINLWPYLPFSQVVANLSLVEEFALKEKLSDRLCSFLQHTLRLEELDALGGKERGRESY